MATDALGLGLALAAIQAASSSLRASQRTFGLYRLEILAALANAVLLFACRGIRALRGDHAGSATRPRSHRSRCSIVGILGLAVNLVAFALAAYGREGEPERGGRLPRGALGHARFGRGRSSVRRSGASRVGRGSTPCSAPRSACGSCRACRLGREALRILVQAAPAGVDVDAVQRDLASIDDVVDVHDVHVWTLTSEMEVAICARDGQRRHRLPPGARQRPRAAPRPARPRPCDLAGRAGRPPRVRRGVLVTSVRWCCRRRVARHAVGRNARSELRRVRWQPRSPGRR